VLFVIGFLWSSEAWAEGFDDVLVTTHNLSIGGTDSLIRDVCLICHVTPLKEIPDAIMATLPFPSKIVPEPAPESPKIPEPEIELSDLGADTTTEQTPEGLIITIADSVLFDIDRYDIKSGAMEVLQKIAKSLRESPSVNVNIFGHTDNTGSADYNQELSKQRAEAVKNQLILNGIMPERIRAIGLGDSFPKVSNDTPEGRQQNRRVELLVTPPAPVNPVEEEPQVTPEEEALPDLEQTAPAAFQTPSMEEGPVSFAVEPDRPQEMGFSSDLERDVTPVWDPRNATEFFLPIPKMELLLGKGEPGKRPFGPSFGCLTCHDGALGNDVHRGGISAGRGEIRKQKVTTVKEDGRVSDHPDSVIYPRSVTGAFSAHSANPNLKRYWSIPDRNNNGVIMPTGPSSTSLGLMSIDPDNAFQTTELVRTFFGMIHCDSCHNPHHHESKPFLRVPANDLCLVCHLR
jgi:predicted CXXCH cytochrome family protein